MKANLPNWVFQSFTLPVRKGMALRAIARRRRVHAWADGQLVGCRVCALARPRAASIGDACVSQCRRHLMRDRRNQLSSNQYTVNSPNPRTAGELAYLTVGGMDSSYDTMTKGTVREAHLTTEGIGVIVQRPMNLFGSWLPVYHFGVRVAWSPEAGFDMVHLTPFSASARYPIRCTESEFAGGKPVSVSQWYMKKIRDRSEVVSRALSAVGDSRSWLYHPEDANCERFVSWCATGDRSFKGLQSTLWRSIFEFNKIGIAVNDAMHKR